MSGPFLFIGTYRVKEGKLHTAKEALGGLTQHVEANEPRLHHFGFYFNDESGEVACVQIHPDSASMEHHMKVIAGHLVNAGEYLDFSAMATRAYGVPSSGLLAELREWDGDALRVFDPALGFNRLPAV